MEAPDSGASMNRRSEDTSTRRVAGQQVISCSVILGVDNQTTNVDDYKRERSGAMTLLIAEGPSYYFHVVAVSKVEANKAFRLAWKRHVEQTGADRDYHNAVTVNYINGLKFNQVYRDYSPL